MFQLRGLTGGKDYGREKSTFSEFRVDFRASKVKKEEAGGVGGGGVAGGELTGFDVWQGLERVGLGGSSVVGSRRAGVGDKRVRRRRKRRG